MRHELGHDMIAKGEVDIDAVRERLIEIVGKENIDAVAEHYANAYAGTEMSAEEIWEECICDSLGDMNIFAGNADTSDFVSSMLPEIKAAASESKSPTQTRGSPEAKASRDFGGYTKKQYNTFGWVRANDVVSEGYWNNFTRNYADAVNNKNYDRIAESDEYMIEIYDENLPEERQVIDHIVFASGSIKNPNVSKIIQICEINENDLSEIRSDVYATEREGLRRETKGIFEVHSAADFGIDVNAQRNISEKQRYNNQFGSERGGSSNAASRVKEYIFEVEESEVSGKASRELDTEYLSAVNSGDTETAQKMVDEAEKKNKFINYNWRPIMAENHWYGKLWYAYGTSMTGGKTGKYVSVVEKLSGMVAVNRGIGGGCLTPDGYGKGNNKRAVMNMNDGKEMADLITLEVLPNEGATVGNIYDTDDESFCGCFNQCIRYLQENTKAQIVVIVMIGDNKTLPETVGEKRGITQFEFAEIIERTARLNGVPVINVFCDSGLGYARVKSRDYQVDHIHMNDLGGKIAGEFIWSKLKDIPLWSK